MVGSFLRARRQASCCPNFAQPPGNHIQLEIGETREFTGVGGSYERTSYRAHPVSGKHKSDRPLMHESVSNLNGPSDYGVYQVYGCHAIYGVDTLLYISKASEQTFAVRLRQESDWVWHSDRQRLSVYVGRLSGWNGTPSNAVWEEHIDRAEKLLILAHRPAYNAQKNIDYGDAQLQEFHVLNWGYHRSLLPEVSGSRYTSKFDNETGYKPFTTKAG